MEIARAEDMGGLIWILVVIGSIIARVVKSSRDAKSGQRPPAGSPTPTASGDELREFLEKISGTSTPAPRPVTPPAPTIVRAPPPVRTRRKVTPKQPPAVAPPPPPMPQEPILQAVIEDEEVKALEPRTRPAIEASELIQLLSKTKKASRRAIVIADVLGKPLAMRENPTAL